MALSVNTLMHGASSVPADYFNQKWLRTLESMLDLLRVDVRNQLITVEPTTGLRYQGDLYGLLTALQIPMQYHWAVMRLNGYTSPEQYDGTILTLVRPADDFIEENLVIFKTLYRTTF